MFYKNTSISITSSAYSLSTADYMSWIGAAQASCTIARALLTAGIRQLPHGFRHTYRRHRSTGKRSRKGCMKFTKTDRVMNPIVDVLNILGLNKVTNCVSGKRCEAKRYRMLHIVRKSISLCNNFALMLLFILLLHSIPTR